MKDQKNAAYGLVLTDQGVIPTQYGLAHITPEVTKRVSGEVDYLLRQEANLMGEEGKKVRCFITRSRKEGFNPEDADKIYGYLRSKIKKSVSYPKNNKQAKSEDIESKLRKDFDEIFVVRKHSSGQELAIEISDYYAALDERQKEIFLKIVHIKRNEYRGRDVLFNCILEEMALS